MLFHFLDILGNVLQKLILVSTSHFFGQGRVARVYLRQIGDFKYLPPHLRHYIVHRSKLWAHNQDMDVLYILRPTREFQILYYSGIHLLYHVVSMLLIKLELDRGSPLSC